MPSRRRYLAGVVGLATAGTAGCLGAVGPSASPGTDAGTEWPLAGYDRLATAYAPDAAAPRSDPGERFRVDLDGTPTDRPTVAGGTVFQPTMAGIEAFAADSGERRWLFRDRADDGAAVFYPPPAVHDGRAYVGTDRGLVAVDAATGEEAWRVETADRVTAPPVPDYEWRYLFVGTDDATVLRVGLDGASAVDAGGVDWRASAYGQVTHLVRSPGLPSGVTAGTAGGEVHHIYDGRGRWRTTVPGSVTALSAGEGNDLYVATFGGGVLRLRTAAHAGRVAWHAADGPVAHGSLVRADGALFGADGAGLASLDAHTGEVRWTLGDDYATPPAAAGDTVYVGGAGEVAAYPLSGGVGLGGTRAGARRWRYPVGNGRVTGVTVAEGAVFAPVDGRQGTPTTLVALE